MKTPICTLIIASICLYGTAQNGNITIKQDNKITKLLDIYESANKTAPKYKIQVYFGSAQKAQTIKDQVDIDFPELYSKIDFESPSYRVRVGRFPSKLEAERKLIEVRKKYPSAMLLKPEKTTK